MNIDILLDAAKFLDQQENGRKNREDECQPERSHLSNKEVVPSQSLVALDPSQSQAKQRNIFGRGIISIPNISSPLNYKKVVQDECFELTTKTLCRSSATNGCSPYQAQSPIIAIESSVVNAFKSGAKASVPDLPVKSLALEVPLLREASEDEDWSGSNGFLRPNGLSKSHSPYCRDYDDQLMGKDDAKKRAGNTPSREVHNKLEKNRRAHLKECFETLRRQLPSMEDKKISNQTILKAAHRYIQTLKRKERDCEHEMERLARQKIAYQQQLAALKKELQAKWDHIDFAAILPDMASLEQQREKETKSTTTASEQPDFEDNSRDSSGHSNSLTLTTSSPELNPPFHPSLHPFDWTPCSAATTTNSYNLTTGHELSGDLNQPLNLSTTSNASSINKSPVNYTPSCSEELSVRCSSIQVANHHYPVSEKSPAKPLISLVHMNERATVPFASISTPVSLGVNISSSTNKTHIAPITVRGSEVANADVTHISHLIHSCTTVPQLSSNAKVATTYSSISLDPAVTRSVTIPHSRSSIGQICTQAHAVIQDFDNQRSTSIVPVSASIANTPHLATIAKLSPSQNICGSREQQPNTLPIIGGNGISIPAQLVASGLQLSGTAGGTLLGQHTIQVITPEGYKLLPSEHGPNGTKSLGIAITHAEGIERIQSEDVKGPVMVALNKNGLSALHLSVPASRAISNSKGNLLPVANLPLNLTVGSSGLASAKVNQSGTTTSILPSYLPLTHTNGITQLVQGVSLVGPIVVSQPQRGIVVSGNPSGSKILKGHISSGGGTTSIPLMPSQCGQSTLGGGLVNSVVVVSAATATVVSQALASSVITTSSSSG